jgi:hypothetical protein
MGIFNKVIENKREIIVMSRLTIGQYLQCSQTH